MLLEVFVEIHGIGPETSWCSWFHQGLAFSTLPGISKTKPSRPKINIAIIATWRLPMFWGLSPPCSVRGVLSLQPWRSGGVLDEAVASSCSVECAACARWMRSRCAKEQALEEICVLLCVGHPDQVERVGDLWYWVLVMLCNLFTWHLSLLAHVQT